MKEYRIFGPPGTGKTTYLIRQIEHAVERHGADAVMVASFTRAAAHELVRRQESELRGNIGTLHSICYHALGCPEIVETRKYLKEWNQYKPEFALSLSDKSIDEDSGEITAATRGDEIFSLYQKCRALRIAEWPGLVESFHNSWRQFKQETNTIDFTDMIERALFDLESAPGSPSIGFFDECQDFSRLELDLVRKWAGHMEWVMLAGDEDQCIYGFKGSSPKTFLSPSLPEDQIRVLGQSYRVPRRIHRMASRWVEQVSERYPKPYAARDAEGEVERSSAHYKYPNILIRRIEEYLKENKTIMILASCSYMLGPLMKTLKEYGLPFHNPYRRRRGDWNPLEARSKKPSLSSRLCAFLSVKKNDGRWRAADFAAWAEVMIGKGVFCGHAKKEIAFVCENVHEFVSDSDILRWFEPDALTFAVSGNIDWLEKNLLAAKRKSMKYPLAIARGYGESALSKQPGIIVGTIHSVKGGEADVVILFPDMSGSGDMAWRRSGEERDAIVRMFYVALTRARESLLLCRAATSNSISSFARYL